MARRVDLVLRVGAQAGLLAIASVVAVPPARACAIFTVAFGDHVYMANNEDYIEPGFVWFVPAGKQRHGRVNFGFADRFAQGGMNDQGLSFDVTVVGEVSYEPDAGKKTPTNLIEKIMNECASVDEAVAYFEKFNCPHLARSQFLFADKSGASVVFSWLPDKGLDVARKDGPYQLITNTRLAASSYRCERFVLAERRLRNGSAYDLDQIRDTLDELHQRGAQAFTSYSNIYDLTLGTVTVYNLGDFGRSMTFNLAEELAKGEHSYELARVFESDGALEAIRAAAPRRYETEITLSASALERFVGTYRVVGPGVDVQIELRDGALVLVPPDNRVAHLFPEEPALFRIRAGGQIRFDVGTEGPVRGFTLYRQGDRYAERID